MTIIPFLNKVNQFILNPIIALLFALSFIYFIYGIVKFLSAGTDAVDKSRVEARNAILWGIVGMVIMFSVFGVIRLLLNLFGISPATTINGVNVEPTKYIETQVR